MIQCWLISEKQRLHLFSLISRGRGIKKWATEACPASLQLPEVAQCERRPSLFGGTYNQVIGRRWSVPVLIKLKVSMRAFLKASLIFPDPVSFGWFAAAFITTATRGVSLFPCVMHQHVSPLLHSRLDVPTLPLLLALIFFLRTSI